MGSAPSQTQLTLVGSKDPRGEDGLFDAARERIVFERYAATIRLLMLESPVKAWREAPLLRPVPLPDRAELCRRCAASNVRGYATCERQIREAMVPPGAPRCMRELPSRQLRDYLHRGYRSLHIDGCRGGAALHRVQ